MREIGWSTLFVEQMHATVTSLLRFHPEYEVNTLLARTIGLCLNRLVPNESADERRLRMLRDRLQRLLRRQPEKVGGRHMYVQDLFALAREKVQKTGVPLQCGYQQKIVKRHGRFFAKVLLSVRRRYSLQAKHNQEMSGREINDNIDLTRSDIAILQQRVEAASKRGKPMIFSTASWGDFELELFSTLSASSDFSNSRVRELRATALITPPPPTQGMMRALDSQPYHEPQRDQVPLWACEVLARRDDFNDTALLFQYEGQEHAWAFLFAIKSPRHLELGRLAIIEPVTPAVDLTWTNLQDLHDVNCRRAFHADFNVHVAASDLPDLALDDITVVQDLRIPWRQRGD